MRLPRLATVPWLLAAVLSHPPTSAATAGRTHPTLRDGDIVFQVSTSRQASCLRKVMRSPYTHVGVVYHEAGKQFVFEAVATVRGTPLDEWIRQDRDGHVVVKRLRGAKKLLTPAAIARSREAGRRHLGKPYDPFFQWSDDRIYCSELVWKIFHEALGVDLSTPLPVGSFDLSDDACTSLIRERFPDGTCSAGETSKDCLDLDEPAVSPAAIFDSDLLELVFRD